MPRGILWVSSRILNPDKLSAERLCDWYENVSFYYLPSLPFPSSSAVIEKSLVS